MKLQALNIRENVSVTHAYFQAGLPSSPDLDVLVVRFVGTSGFGCANNSDAIYMEAMVRAGITAFDPSGVVLDLREMAYEWGDMMVRPFGNGYTNHIGEDLSVVAVISEINREGLRSLVTEEMQSDPSELLFDSMESALCHLDAFE